MKMNEDYILKDEKENRLELELDNEWKNCPYGNMSIEDSKLVEEIWSDIFENEDKSKKEFMRLLRTP